jgi:predicted AAA+ superfamily ATPase
MERAELYGIINDQQKEFLEDSGLIHRPVEETIINALKAKMPIILTGIRRCGKSSLLKLIKNRLSIDEKSWLYIDFNDERLIRFATEDFQKIIDYMQEQDFKKKSYLFVDEIQETKGWEKWIDRIKEKYIIILTGSNSKLLSSELSTILTGRSINIKVYPFSFSEYLNAKKINIESIKIDIETQNKTRRAFSEYLEYGGFPKRVITGQNIILTELYENIIYKDILTRFSGKQSKSIKELTQYLLSNISKQTSTRTLSAISQIKNLGTIKRIMDTLEASFLIVQLSKFDYSIKKQIQNPKKVYCIDNGIATTNGFRFSENKGQLLENAIFIELKRQGLEIYYYLDKQECDFIIKKGLQIVDAIQVCYRLKTDNKDREIKGLLDAVKKYKLKEGKILTFDQEETITKEKIKIHIMPAWKWLVEQ